MNHEETDSALFDAALGRLHTGNVDARVRAVQTLMTLADAATDHHKQRAVDALCAYLRMGVADPTLETAIVMAIRERFAGEHAQKWRCCRVDVSDVDFFTDVSLERCQFGAFTCVHTHFHGCVSFDFAEFGKGSSFNGATFDQNVSFVGAHFGDDVSFDEVSCADQARFTGAQFGKDASFCTARFAKGANFKDAVFGDWANLWRAQFGPGSSFRNGVFVRGAYFVEASFGDDADFGGVAIGFGSSLAETTWGNRCTFAAAAFDEATYFGYARFGDDTDFRDATFGPDLFFDFARFGARTRFDGTTFTGRAVFSRAQFGANSSFTKVCGDGLFRFDHALFESGASFERANFAAASFVRFRFGVVSFRHMRCDRTNFWLALIVGPATFQQAMFGDGLFDHAAFGAQSSFAGAEFSRLASFKHVKVQDESLLDGVVFRGEYEVALLLVLIDENHM